MECIEVFFGGYGYELYWYDIYVIGQMIVGVQSFYYCGGFQYSLFGGMMVFYLDEIYDGEVGIEVGFYYCMVYIELVLIQKIFGGRLLLFIFGGLLVDLCLWCVVLLLLKVVMDIFELLEEEDVLYDLVQILVVVGG